ncbi:LCP family protein [Candidatus Dojkabacteria bacterium]|nr:LCP family protein [Candidatus Dojkabacteria bacterium]
MNKRKLTKLNNTNIFSLIWRHKIFFLTVFILSFVIGILAFPTKRQDGSNKSLLSDGMGYINEVIDHGAGSLINQTDGYTSVLLMGIDSRKVDFNGQEFSGNDLNVDVIMQIIYDHKNNNIFMISIPRDTGYAVEEECANQSFDKAINRLYKYGQKGNCVNGGIGLMLKYTEKITGFKNNYYGLISFDTFYDVVEAVGEEHKGMKGLWIDVPETIYELYPTDTGFESVTFKKGMQFMDSKLLLKYARSRKNSSDFARTRRQQIIIGAIKEQMLKLDALKNPTKLKALYDSFRDNSLYSELNVKELIAIIGMIQKIKTAEIYHIVLDNDFGGTNNLILKPSYSPPYKGHARSGFYLTPKHYKAECCKVDEYLKVKNFLKSIIVDPTKIEQDYKE